MRAFLRMAASGVYDGTAFHRVARGFVIQGGYLPSRREPLEPSAAGLRACHCRPNSVRRLTIAASCRWREETIPGSATSSFFIVLARTQALDNQYTVFGRVVEGLDVIEKIEAVAGQRRDACHSHRSDARPRRRASQTADAVVRLSDRMRRTRQRLCLLLTVTRTAVALADPARRPAPYTGCAR